MYLSETAKPDVLYVAHNADYNGAWAMGSPGRERYLYFMFNLPVTRETRTCVALHGSFPAVTAPALHAGIHPVKVPRKLKGTYSYEDSLALVAGTWGRGGARMPAAPHSTHAPALPAAWPCCIAGLTAARAMQVAGAPGEL